MKTLLTFSSAYKDGTKVVKTRVISHNKRYLCSFLLGLSNNSSKPYSETLLIWACITFLGFPLLQNQVFKLSGCFWKVNGDEQSLRNEMNEISECKQLIFCCEMGEQNLNGETDPWVYKINLFQVCYKQY